MAKYCPNCGAEMKEDQDVCLQCGKSVKKEKTVVVSNTKSNQVETAATTSLILGLVSIISWIFPLIGYATTICGIIFGAMGLKSSKKSLALTGLILSIIFLLATLTNSILGVILQLK